MRILILTFFIFFNCLTLFGQSYFSKTYDLYDHQWEEPRNIGFVNNSLFVSGLKNNIYDAYQIVSKFDLDGNLLFSKKHPSSYPCFGAIFEKDFFHFGGTKFPEYKKWVLYKTNAEGDSITQKEYEIPGDRWDYFSVARFVSNGNQFIMGRNVIDLQDSTYYIGEWRLKSKALIAWINKDLSLDTFTVIEPEFLYCNIVDLKVNSDSNVIVSYIFTRLFNNNGNLYDEAILAINIYAKDKKLISHREIAKTKDGGGILNVQKDKSITFAYSSISLDTFVASVSKYDSLGYKLWEYRFPTNYEKVFYFNALASSSDGGIIGCGSIGKNLVDSIESTGFIFKLDANGNKLWDRVFGVRGKNLDYPKYAAYLAGSFSDIKELPNGDLIIGGNLRNNYFDTIKNKLDHQDDIWLVKTDRNGCIVPNCGSLQQVTPIHEVIVPSEDKLIIFPNPTNGVINVSEYYESYIVHDNFGKIVKAGNYTPEIDLFDVQNGMFFLQLKVSNHLKNFKIIKL